MSGRKSESLQMDRGRRRSSAAAHERASAREWRGDDSVSG